MTRPGGVLSAQQEYIKTSATLVEIKSWLFISRPALRLILFKPSNTTDTVLIVLIIVVLVAAATGGKVLEPRVVLRIVRVLSRTPVVCQQVKGILITARLLAAIRSNRI